MIFEGVWSLSWGAERCLVSLSLEVAVRPKKQLRGQYSSLPEILCRSG